MNKQILFSVVFTFISSFGFSGEPAKVSSKIEEVKVFVRGAHVSRSASVMINEGVQQIKFTGLSPSMDGGSIQLEGVGDFTILSVMHQLNYLSASEKPDAVKQLEDSIEFISDKIEINQKLRQVFTNEISILDANKQMKVNEKSLYVEDLEDLSNFIRERYSELALKLLEIDKTEKHLSKKLQEFQNQLAVIAGERNRPTSEIIVEVSSSKKIQGKFTFGYFVSEAGWSAAYDIRAKDIQSPLVIDYKAKVWQNTGEEWEIVKLSLSNGNPSRASNKPNPIPWLLKPITPVRYATMDYKKAEGRAQQSQRNTVYELNSMAPMAGAESMDADIAATGADAYTTIDPGQLNVDFNIKIPYTIPSDAKEHSVQVQKIDVSAIYEYYTAPKYEKEAFLLARVGGWGDLNLLSGMANIYNGGAFTGTTYISTRTTNDTLDISLGRDAGVIVERTRVKDFEEKKIVGSSKKETMGIQVSVKNNKNAALNIVIQDQIPVSGDKDIEVELLESGESVHESETGYLKWHVKIEPNSSFKKVFKYSVKYPKDKIVQL